MENSLSRTIIIVAETAVIAFIMPIAIFSFRQSREITKAQDMITMQNDRRSQNSDLIRYSGASVRGSDVLNIIKEHRETDTAFIVENASGLETIYNYTDTGLTDKVSDSDFESSLDKAKEPENAAYIKPLKTYTCSIKENDNTKAIEAVIFTES